MREFSARHKAMAGSHGPKLQNRAFSQQEAVIPWLQSTSFLCRQSQLCVYRGGAIWNILKENTAGIAAVSALSNLRNYQ